jgi:hypothetical protein
MNDRLRYILNVEIRRERGQTGPLGTILRRRLISAGAGLALVAAAVLSADPGIALATRAEPPAAESSAQSDPNNQGDSNIVNTVSESAITSAPLMTITGP